MIKIRKSNDRGDAKHGWLNSRHTFSFADYYAPEHMGFRSLRVINEDRIIGGSGFPRHGHKDMEIISYVIDGALEHSDSAGNKTVIRPGEVQRMSAGVGVAHAEYNHSQEKEAHFFQIWIQPDKKGLPFSYGQKSFEEDLAKKKLVLTLSRNGRDGSIAINQDVDLYIARLKKGEALPYETKRHVWAQVVKGTLTVNGQKIQTGDGLEVSDEQKLEFKAEDDSEILLFDLA